MSDDDDDDDAAYSESQGILADPVSKQTNEDCKISLPGTIPSKVDIGCVLRGTWSG